MQFGKKIDRLLRNEWELYDVKKMMKRGLILVLMFVIFGAVFFVFSYFFFYFAMERYDLDLKVAIGGVFFLLVIVSSLVNARRIDVGKRGWYFSAYRTRQLDGERIIQAITDALTDRNMIFREKKTRRAETLWISYFSFPGKDYRVRVWFSKGRGEPILELGVGPVSAVNGGPIEEMKTLLSNVVREMYGDG